jgi:hypothetical protein
MLAHEKDEGVRGRVELRMADFYTLPETFHLVFDYTVRVCMGDFRPPSLVGYIVGESFKRWLFPQGITLKKILGLHLSLGGVG